MITYPDFELHIDPISSSASTVLGAPRAWICLSSTHPRRRSSPGYPKPEPPIWTTHWTLRSSVSRSGVGPLGRMGRRDSPRIRALMREHQDEIAHVITIEHGKPHHQAQAEVTPGCELFEWDVGDPVRAYGRVIPSGPELAQRQFAGDFGLILDWFSGECPKGTPVPPLIALGRYKCDLASKIRIKQGLFHLTRRIFATYRRAESCF